MAHFWKNCKKVKKEVTGTEKRFFLLIYVKSTWSIVGMGSKNIGWQPCWMPHYINICPLQSMNEETNMDHWPMRSFEHHPSVWSGYILFCNPHNSPSTFPQIYFFGSCYFNLTFLQFSQNAPDYIDPFGHFVFYEHFCSSNFYNSFFSSIVENLNISAIYKSIILICSVNLPVISIYKFCRKEI